LHVLGDGQGTSAASSWVFKYAWHHPLHEQASVRLPQTYFPPVYPSFTLSASWSTSPTPLYSRRIFVRAHLSSLTLEIRTPDKPISKQWHSRTSTLSLMASTCGSAFLVSTSCSHLDRLPLSAGSSSPTLTTRSVSSEGIGPTGGPYGSVTTACFLYLSPSTEWLRD
jgi:hypothetical protein